METKRINFEKLLIYTSIAHKESIKAIIVDVQEEKLRELALIENIQREDLNPIDLAQSYKELIEDYGITHEELAKKLSKSRTQITNTLRLLELDKNVQKYVLENKISQGHAKVLVALPKEQQNIIANSIIGQKLSVHDTENLIRKLKEGQLQDKKISSLAQNRISPHSKEQLEKICKAIQKQNLNIKLQKNKIIVEFSNDEEVERFSKILPNISF